MITNITNIDDIIYEFINLGAIIKGYSEYTEYIESIKFLEKKVLKNVLFN